MLRTFCGTEDTSLKSNLTKEKKLAANIGDRLSLEQTDLAMVIPKTRGLNRSPWPWRV
jgi:hypothetical protein